MIYVKYGSTLAAVALRMPKLVTSFLFENEVNNETKKKTSKA